MANMQKYFFQFHEEIRTGYSKHAPLREKRDTLLGNLRDKLDISFENFNQGSYAIHTGIKPIHGDYDIDVGLIFTETSENEFPDPFCLKQKIQQALEYTNRTVKIKRPCVTVQYKKDGNNTYHIDFAIYKKDFSTGNLMFARGKSSDDEEKRWENSAPKDLINFLTNKFNEIENNEEKEAKRQQFNRCIRALKRWKNVKLNHKNLPSIALTVAMRNLFEPYFFNNEFNNPNDAQALMDFLGKFYSVIHKREITLSVEPYSNLLGNLTSKQADEICIKIKRLKDDLELIQKEEITINTACQKMRKHFGKDFPLPEESKQKYSSEQFIENMFPISKKMQSLSLKLEIKNNAVVDFILDRLDISRIIPKYRKLVFSIQNAADFEYGTEFYWKVLNIGDEAERRNCIRGTIEKGEKIKYENSDFNGAHYVECYAIKNGVCIAREHIDVPIQ